MWLRVKSVVDETVAMQEHLRAGSKIVQGIHKDAADKKRTEL